MEKNKLPSPTKKSILITKACHILLAEEMDKLRNTSAYRQDTKNLVNKLSHKLDQEYSEVYSIYDDSDRGRYGFNLVVNLIEDFVDKIGNMRSAEELIEFNEHLKTL